MIINRSFCMPSSDTFTMKPIRELLQRYILPTNFYEWIDTMAKNSKMGFITNDLNPNTDATYHMEAIDFLKMLKKDLYPVYGVLFDPPYSPTQVKECYEGIGLKCTQKETQATYYTHIKDAIAELKPIYVISFGWNSNGMCKSRGYQPVEILLVQHGGMHNDTICVVDKIMNKEIEENGN